MSEPVRREVKLTPKFLGLIIAAPGPALIIRNFLTVTYREQLMAKVYICALISILTSLTHNLFLKTSEERVKNQ